MTKKIIIILVCVFVFSIIGIVITYSATDSVDFGKTITIDEEKTFTIDEVNNIKINTSSSDVNFILVDGNETTAKYYGEVHCFACNLKYKLTGDKMNNTVEFKTRFTSFGIQLFSDVNLDIYIPRTYANKLNISTSSADVIIKDLSSTLSDLVIDTSSGDIELVNIEVENKTDLSTSSGDITLKSVSSDIDFYTSSGDLDVSNLDGDFIGITSSGEIDLHSISENFYINIRTSSGDVDVNVNNEASFDFTTSTSSGDIEVNFTYTVDGTTNTEDYITGSVGESSNNELIINTSSGDITIS